MSRTLKLTSLMVLAASACLLTAAPASGKGATPDLTGFHAYNGSYVRNSSSQGFAFEVERQKGRKLEALTIAAMNERTFRGKGKISKDHLTFKATSHTEDKKKKNRTYMILTGNVVNGGLELDGTYELRHPAPGNTLTGTFFVSR